MEATKGLKIMLIEDDDDHAKIISLYLSHHDEEVFLIRSSTLSEGISQALSGTFHVILLDLRLPDSDIDQTLGVALAKCPDIPIIVLSSIEDKVLARKMVQQGAQDYLCKSDLSTELLMRSISYSIERKKNEILLKESELRKSKMIESSLDCIISIDEAGNVIEFNSAAKKVFGYSLDEVMGKSLADLIIPVNFREQHRLGLAKFIETGVGPVLGRRVEMPALRRDGTEFPVELSIIPLKVHNRFIFTGFLRDISDRKKAAEAEILRRENEVAAAANRELEAFSYSVSHDLRAPLRAIDGFSALLLEDIKSLPENTKDYLERIRHSAQKMSQLIDDLLTFSRLGRQGMNIQKIDVSELVKEVLDEFHNEIENHHIEVHQEFLSPCRGDRALLKQVWINLLSNAFKYSWQKNHALVEIGSNFLESTKEMVYFVKDNGVGFDMHYVDKLFGVFQRLHKAEEFEGTGIGLAIVKRIIERCGGRVWADAEVNKGATFYFTIPNENAIKN